MLPDLQKKVCPKILSDFSYELAKAMCFSILNFYHVCLVLCIKMAPTFLKQLIFSWFHFTQGVRMINGEIALRMNERKTCILFLYEDKQVSL